MKKLSNRSYTLHKMADFAGVILLVGLLLFIWQLYRGSISLPFLKPYIIRALNHEDTDYEVTLDGVNLELVRSVQPLRIIANNVVYKKEGYITINAPKVALSFSIRALLKGVIAPSTIEINQPQIFVFSKYGLKEDKSSSEINRKKLEYYFDQAGNFWERFNSEDNTYPESYINTIEISKADVELLEVDLGKKWRFSDVNYVFDRGFGKLNTEINALMPFTESTSSVGLSVEYDYGKSEAEMKFYFSDLIPANLLQLITPANASKDFYNIRIPLHGSLSTILNLENLQAYKSDMLENSSRIIDKISFAFEGEKGKIKFSADENYDYDVSGLVLKGEISGNLEDIKISDANLDLDNQKASLGFEIKGLKEYLLHSSKKDLKIRILAKIKELETNMLTKFWPKYFGDKAWKWCHESLFDGYIKNGDFAFDFGYDKKEKAIVFKSLSGVADIENGTVLYLNEMPKVTGIYGKAHFSEQNIEIDVSKAISDDVVLSSGFIDLYDLNKEDNFLKLRLEGVGSISNILRLIDHEPLKYPSSMGIKPDSIKGSAVADLSLDFELRQDLAPEDVNVNVKGEVEKERMEKKGLNDMVENGEGSESNEKDLSNHRMEGESKESKESKEFKYPTSPVQPHESVEAKETISSGFPSLIETTSPLSLPPTPKDMKEDTYLFEISKNGDISLKKTPETEAKPSEQEEHIQSILEASAEQLQQIRKDLSQKYRHFSSQNAFVSENIIMDIVEILHIFGIPYVFAPGEAEAQCAFLNLMELVDGVISNDSDVFAFGGKTMYRNFFVDNRFVEVYKIEDIEKERGLNRNRIIELALLLGCDYCEVGAFQTD